MDGASGRDPGCPHCLGMLPAPRLRSLKSNHEPAVEAEAAAAAAAAAAAVVVVVVVRTGKGCRVVMRGPHR